jgi:nucleoside-diphosphate-sugar epimerase
VSRDLASEALVGLDATVGPRCLVTGGAGYLGRHLVRALSDLGCEVRSLDAAPWPESPAATPKPDRLDQRLGDVRDRHAVEAACQGIDTVFHAAAALSFAGLAPASVRERVSSINVGGTEVVIDACRAQSVGRLVYTSSLNVALDRELLEADETAPYAETWVDLYGPSKARAERAVLGADQPGGLRTTALRPGGIWGPGGGGYMIRAFLEQLAAGRFVATIGDGTAVVDNTHVHSLVRAELLAAQALATEPARAGGRAYSITDDERINGIEWFRPLAEGLGQPWPSRRVPGGLMYAVAWLGELAHLLGAAEPAVTRIGVLKLIRGSSFRIDRAREELGYEPLVGRDQGIALHLPDYRRTWERLRDG